MRTIIICRNCGNKKELVAFGLCRSCYMKQYRQNNREKFWIADKKYRQKNRKSVLAYLKIYNKNRHNNCKVINVKIRKMGNNQYWIYNTGKYVHIAIAERVLGRRFRTGECTHHFDGNGLNNLHSNLMICTKSYHTWLHEKIRQGKKKRDLKGQFA